MAGKHQRGRNWYLSWYQSGQLHRQSIGPVTEAEAEAARLAKERALIATAAAGPAFCDWAVTYATWHSAEYPDSYPRVEGIIRCHLLPVFRDTPIAAITRAQVESYKHAPALSMACARPGNARIPRACAGYTDRSYAAIVAAAPVMRSPLSQTSAPTGPVPMARTVPPPAKATSAVPSA